MADEPIFTVEVPVYDVSDKILVSRTVAKGQLGEDELEMLIAIPALSPVVRFRGKEYMVLAPELASSICMRVKYG